VDQNYEIIKHSHALQELKFANERMNQQVKL